MLEVIRTAPPYLTVKPSAVHGRGLFTTQAFQKGDRLAIITGPLINLAEALRQEREEANYYIYCHSDDVFIDASGGIGRWVNHSCEPSAEVTGRDEATLWLIAGRDLVPGDEITLDYDDGQIYDFCRERNPTCRGEECPKGKRK
jgi:SET domain-containing protein